MLARFPGFFSNDGKRVLRRRHGPKCKQIPPPLAAFVIALAAYLTPGIFAGWGSNSGFVISAAHAQPTPEDVEKFKKDVQKFQEDVQKKFHTLMDKLRGSDLPEGFAKTNGRIEATEIDISPKYAGRLESVDVNEGDEVKAGQVLAVIKSPEYEAQLRNTQANVLVAKSALASAEAKVAQAKADQIFAEKDLERGKDLVAKGWMTKQVFDQRVDKADGAKAALEAADKQREAAKSTVLSNEAEVERISSIIADLTLLSPRDGRVQYRIHRSGEVVNAGTRILQILDLSDVYMTIYLPASEAGRLALGDEARMILDPYPDLVIPAHVSFVATEAQFTPKPVETAAEREKLIFRVKLQVDPKVLTKYHSQVKTGIRGLGFVRTGPNASWPENLAVKLPEEQQVQSGQSPRPETSPDQGGKQVEEDQSKQQTLAVKRRQRSSRSPGQKTEQ
jgi:HlyD family secretion protein